MDQDPVLDVPGDGSRQHRPLGLEPDPAQIVDRVVMRMAEQDGGFMIEPGATLTLEPGGAHLMLENLNHDLRPGMTFTVRLTFVLAGELEIDVTVGAEAPDGDLHQLGDLLISPAWSLPAPSLGDATPSD